MLQSMPISRRRALVAGLTLALLGGHQAAVAADAAVAKAARAPGSPPRIGLALSGGGARGIAHVGVLKVLDEMRIPIHCVTGTSMGAVVGGTFAAGRTPMQLEELVNEANWNELFRDAPPRNEISMRRKVDDYKTLFAPEFGVKDGGLALPKGVIAGVSIEAFFRILVEPSLDINNFNKLPIPYRAMATDIETGNSVELSHGSLPQAMRASMSVPGGLAPVEIDGKLLVDGGIANNLPIDQARELCGDVIIAVNISTPPMKRKDITSALSVSAQLLNFLGLQTVEKQIKSLTSADVLIAPELGNITAGSFERSRDAIRIGEEATRKMAASLSRYSIAPAQYAAFRARQVASDKALGEVAEIRFEGLERTNPAVLRGLVETKPGEPLSEKKIGTDLRRIYGRGDFEGVDYRILGEGGPRAMVIKPTEKSWGGDYLRFGLGLQSDFQGDNQFNVLVQYRRTWLNKLGAEWLLEGQVGQDTHLSSEFYQPLNEQGIWFGSVYGNIGQLTRNVFSGDKQIAEYLVGNLRGGVDLGAVLGTKGVVRLGAVWTDINAKVDTGDPVLPSIKQLTAGPRLQLTIDQLDHAFYATAGYSAYLNAYLATKSFGSAQNYQQIQGFANYAKSWGPHTLNFHIEGGSALGTDMPAYESFLLGGPLRLSGFRIGQYAGREFVFGRAMYYNRVKALPDLLGSGVYIGASAEVGRITDRFDNLPVPGTLYSGSIFLGADTFAGPAYLGIGVGNGGSVSGYLLLGAP